jgi:hypothetical protein
MLLLLLPTHSAGIETIELALSTSDDCQLATFIQIASVTEQSSF